VETQYKLQGLRVIQRSESIVIMWKCFQSSLTPVIVPRNWDLVPPLKQHVTMLTSNTSGPILYTYPSHLSRHWNLLHPSGTCNSGLLHSLQALPPLGWNPTFQFRNRTLFTRPCEQWDGIPTLQSSQHGKHNVIHVQGTLAAPKCHREVHEASTQERILSNYHLSTFWLKKLLVSSSKHSTIFKWNGTTS
jgi:hypothetical protein